MKQQYKKIKKMVVLIIMIPTDADLTIHLLASQFLITQFSQIPQIFLPKKSEKEINENLMSSVY